MAEGGGEAAHRLSCLRVFNRAGRGDHASVAISVASSGDEAPGEGGEGAASTAATPRGGSGLAGDGARAALLPPQQGGKAPAAGGDGCRGDGPISLGFKTTAFAGQVALTCSVALITQGSKAGGADYGYNTMTVPFWSELLKLALSAALLARENAGAERPTFVLRGANFGAAAVPALLYLITNNLNFVIIHEIGALSFQILNNFKIVTAAILFQLVMRRQLSGIQWRGVLLLTVGSMISQLKDCAPGGFAMTGTRLGYALKAVNCTLTSFAGVYCEKFLKHSNDSIHFQNLQLYFWGSAFATLSLLASAARSGAGLEMLWAGQNAFSVALIINYASVGLATAFVLKYLDNIAKNFAAVAAMFAAAFAAWALFDEALSLHLYIGLTICSMAADLYVRHASLAGAPQ
eukprot:jgi/Tetstr1/432849/TSEL_022198.t1